MDVRCGLDPSVRTVGRERLRLPLHDSQLRTRSYATAPGG